MKKEAISGLKWTSLASIVTIIVGLMQIAVLSRYLTKEEIGIYSLITILISFATNFSDLGFSNGIVHFQKLERSVLDTLYSLNIISSIIIYGLLLLSSNFLENYNEVNNLGQYAFWIGLSLPFHAIGRQYHSLFQKNLIFNTIAIIRIIQSFIIFLSTLVLLLQLKMGLFSIIIGITIGSIFYGISFYFLGIQKFGKPKFLNFDFGKSMPCIKFGLFQLGQSIFNVFSANLDKLAIGNFFGMEILGAYELAYRLIKKPMQLINPIFSQISFPILSKVQNDPKRVNRIYLQKIMAVSFATIPIYLGILALIPEITYVLYGSGWELTTSTFLIIWLLGISKSLDNPMGSYLLALGRPDIGLYSNIYNTLIFAAIIFVGGTFFQYHDMLIFMVVIFIIFSHPVSFFIRQRLTKMSPIAFIKAILPNVIIGTIMFLVVKIIKNLIHVDLSELTVIAICALAGSLVYFALIFKFNKKMLAIIKN